MNNIKVAILLCFFVGILLVTKSSADTTTPVDLPEPTKKDTINTATPRFPVASAKIAGDEKPTPPTVKKTLIQKTVVKAPTPPYVECPENGKNVICFGNYYNELPKSSHDNVEIVPKFIVIHWDGRPAGNTQKWVSQSTWHGLANREDGGKSAHFAVGLDGVGQFLPMYKDTVMQSRAASYYYDPVSINIEMAGRDYNDLLTGKADADTEKTIIDITDKTINLVIKLMNQYDIPIENILGHYQVLEGKDDPGDKWLPEYFLPLLRDRIEKDS